MKTNGITVVIIVAPFPIEPERSRYNGEFDIIIEPDGSFTDASYTANEHIKAMKTTASGSKSSEDSEIWPQI